VGVGVVVDAHEHDVAGHAAASRDSAVLPVTMKVKNFIAPLSLY
jgi:hypothetical protein